MAGSIGITETDWWNAPSWAYHWVIEFLIANVPDEATVADLREVDENNLGVFCVDDLAEGQRTVVQRLLSIALVPDAKNRLLLIGPERDAAIGILTQLAERATAHLESE